MICGIFMIVCSTFVVLFFLLKKGPLYVKTAWRENQDLLKMPADPFTKLFKLLIVVLKSMLRIFTNIEVVYYLTYGALAYVAMMVHPFFYAFHLTEFIIRYPTLSSVLQSIWEPKMQLLLSYILIILFDFYFSLIGFIWL